MGYNLSMKRVVKKFKNFKEAEQAEIEEQISMTPQQRQQIAKMLKEKIYGKNPPDVRESHRKQK